MYQWRQALRSSLIAAAFLLAGPAAMAADQPAYHLYRLPKPGRARTAAPTMLYYGGPVIGTVKVEAVFWGSTVSATTVKGIGPFLAAMANSTYTDQLAQYATNLTGVNGHPGTNQTIGRGTLAGTATIAPKNTSLSLTDAAVRAELHHQITTGKLPRQDPNTLYMVYFPANITISLGSAVSCQSFGAYHEATPGKPGSANLFYGVMPDCGGGFTEQTVASSHEFAEAVTDAIPTPGSHPAYPQAWNTSGGEEIGDLCEGRDTTLKTGKTTYTVQEVFDAKTNACATGKFVSP